MDRTIPAPPNTVCPGCQRVIGETTRLRNGFFDYKPDLNIVRFNGKIFHDKCFEGHYIGHHRHPGDLAQALISRGLVEGA